LAHRSGDNNTEKSRVAIYLTYNAAREGDKRDHYYDEKRRLFPPASDREEGKNYGKLSRVWTDGHKRRKSNTSLFQMKVLSSTTLPPPSLIRIVLFAIIMRCNLCCEKIIRFI
jgi:hypothetical protein